jgi:hypothetical protein
MDRGAQEASRHGIARSTEWPKIEREHREKEPTCAVCGSKDKIQVHHVFPFHYCIALGRPDLELDDRNLISLCESQPNDHHLLIGHLDSFQSSNLKVRADVSNYIHQDETQIKANTTWQSEVNTRLKPLDKMTDQDKADFVKLMNETYPLMKK